MGYYLLLLAGFVVLFSLIGGMLFYFKAKREKINQTTEQTTCPLCNSRLNRGERIKSVVFSKGSNKKPIGIENAIRVYIYGCPYCYPPPKPLKRICPVCGKVLPLDGYLIGKMWIRNGKNHLHINGCTRCLKV